MQPETPLTAAHGPHALGSWPTSEPSESFGGRTVTIEGGIVLYELCWQQPDDGRLVACDRKKGHLGRHSWEATDA